MNIFYTDFRLKNLKNNGKVKLLNKNYPEVCAVYKKSQGFQIWEVSTSWLGI